MDWKLRGNYNFALYEKITWQERKGKACWGKRNIEADGCIHCSTVEYFWRVAHNFNHVKDELVLVCIDESKLKAEVKYEDGTYQKKPSFRISKKNEEWLPFPGQGFIFK